MAQGVATSDRAWWARAGEAPRHRFPGPATRRSIYVPAADGTKIATHVFLPAGVQSGERLPAVLNVTPYFSAMEYRGSTRKLAAKVAMQGGLEIAMGLAPFGFAVVLVDIRGSGASFGRRKSVMIEQVVADVGDVMDWVVAQSWSNGRIGATGISAVGMAAEWLATNAHPALKAIMPRFTVFDVYGGTHGGGVTASTFMQDVGKMLRAMDANRLGDMPPAVLQRVVLRALVRGVQPCDEDHDRSLLAAAAREHEGNEYLDGDLVAVTNRDDPMPSTPDKTIDAQSPFAFADGMREGGVAIYAEAGWCDGGFIREMISLHNTVRGPRNRLTIGPWPHGGRWYSSPLVERKVPTAFDHYAEMARFFDLHLRDVDGGIGSEPAVHYFTTGEEQWKAADCWPPPGAVVERYNLAPAGTLTTAAVDDERTDRHRFDLSATTGPDSRYGRHLAGGRFPVRYPDRAKKDRGLLIYDSAPLARDTEVTGSPILHLFASFSTPDAAVFAYLEDVGTDAVVRHVTDGVLCVARRGVTPGPAPYWVAGPWRSLRRDEREPAPPGEVVELTFDLYPTSHLFLEGHRVRLAFAGGDIDTMMPLPLDGAVPEIGVRAGGSNGSFLELPVMPR